MTAFRPFLAMLALAATCSGAQAERSRLADDAGVVEAGDCEIETAFERKSVRGSARERGSSIQFGCGIGWQTELVASFARKHSDGATREEAVGLEAKTSLRKRGDGRIGLTLVLGVGGERLAGGPWRRNEHSLALEATYAPAQGWLIEAKFGSARDRFARNDKTLWLLGVEHRLTETLEARAEIGGDDRRRPLLGVALRWQFWPENASVKVSYGTRAGPERERLVSAAFSFEF